MTAAEGPAAVLILQETNLGRPLTEEEKRRVLDNDYKALSALYKNLSGWPATGDLLPSITVLCFLYAGDKDSYHDGAKEAVKHIQHASFVSIPGLAHGETFERSDLVLPYAKKFLSSVINAQVT